MSKEDFMVGQLRALGISTVINGTTINVKMRDDAGDVLFATGLTVPSDGSSGYAKGCIFIDTNVATGTTGFYTNNGTRTSSAFVASEAVAGTDASVLTSTVTSLQLSEDTYDSQLLSYITSELADRAADESTIVSKLTSEIADRAADESTISSTVTSEIADRGADESTITSKVTSEGTRLDAADSTVTSKVTSEAARADAADSTVTSKLTSEISDRGTDESTLTSSVTSGDLRFSVVESKILSFHP